MHSIEKFLQKNDYRTLNIDYPSNKYSIERLCALYVKKTIDSALCSHDTVHFVTHSLGGIIVRYCLNDKDRIKGNVGRIVMLCPPNQGSSLADSLATNLNWFFRFYAGPAGAELTRQKNGIVHHLETTGYKIGIIAGDKNIEPWFRRYLDGKNDGKVQVEETALAGSEDFIVLHHSHTFMMNNDDTKYQILSFIKNGKFEGKCRGLRHQAR